MRVPFNFDATGIGSAPFTDPAAACEEILLNFTDIPFWPQLPKRSFLENMYVQYSEQLPGAVIDHDNKTIHIDTAKAISDIERVYGKIVEGDIDFFRISEEYAAGLYAFLKIAGRAGLKTKYVKGHITGPVSFGLSVTDQEKRSVIYNKDIFEVLVKMLTMKARWQVRALKEISQRVIMFIDEPYLVSIGSSYVTINAGEVMPRLDEIISAIKEEGALAGVHCCGNTDWSLLLKRNIDVLNFDAYNFSKEFALYGDEIGGFLDRGGTIAWGIIPSSKEIAKTTAELLSERMKEAYNLVSAKLNVADKISSIISPSCGLGSLDEGSAKDIFRMTQEVSKRFKDGAA